MKIKRILTTLIGFPIIACLVIFGNVYTMDIFVAIIACLCIYEYNKAFKNKHNPLKLIGYILAITLAFLHVIPQKALYIIAITYIPIVVLISFIKSLINSTKMNVIDVAITVLGITYVIGFLTFLSLLYSAENGKILFWYVLFSAWGSDTFAYLIGVKFGKHKLCNISPKKTIEGSIAGIIGATIFSTIYTIVINNFVTLNISIWYIIIVGIVLSIIGQIGDLAASSIKRYNGIKDFSQLIPGHGGILDRIDSIIFIAPFAYLLLIVL